MGINRGGVRVGWSDSLANVRLGVQIPAVTVVVYNSTPRLSATGVSDTSPWISPL